MKTDPLLKILLIGCGRIAPKHLEAIESLDEKDAKIIKNGSVVFFEPYFLEVMLMFLVKTMPKRVIY